ncbi:MAG: ATP-binding protein [Enterobacterales bacterium]|nr:ATP-binding protein [Enterobacterales bacterium]
MPPILKPIATVAISGLLLITLSLIIDHFQGQKDETKPSIQTAALQVSQQVSQDMVQITKGLHASAADFIDHKDWSIPLDAHLDIFRAATVNQLLAYDRNKKRLFTHLGRQKKIDSDLQNILKQLNKDIAKNNFPIQRLSSYNNQLAIYYFDAIENNKHDMSGAVIAIQIVNKSFLQKLQNIAGYPIILTQQGNVVIDGRSESAKSKDGTIITVNWPSKLKSKSWKILLFSETKSNLLENIFLILSALIVIGACILVYLQIKPMHQGIKTIKSLFDLSLPNAEQITRLSDVHNIETDLAVLDCVGDIRARLEQLFQQKKSLALEVRKLQENQQELEKEKTIVEKQLDTAVAAPKLKSQFLSRMGDEITTPMKSVVSMLKLLSEYPFEPEPKQLLAIAKRSTRTLVNNLNNILDFSKLDADMLKLKKTFSVRQIVDDLASELSHFANEKDLSLMASCSPDMPEVISADEYRVKQILRNLLGNAVRFTKQGEVSVYADIVENNSKKLIRFTIADTGIGISPQAQKELFDSLQQTTKLTNSSFAGRIRLIVSKQLAELMGGEIGVISEVGKGSQFWFTVAY